MIAARAAAVRERLSRAAARAGRRPDEITLVAVSKTHPPEAVREAHAAGLRDFGENKVQEAQAKLPALGDLEGVRWHLVGHLQSNKAKKAVALFDRIHSLDSLPLAQKLEQAAAEAGRTLDVLVQVDLAGEATKHGTDAEQLLPLLEQLRGLRALRATGLMLLPPFDEDPQASRPYFARLRDGFLAAGVPQQMLRELSMGMSHDFEVAIEEGATLVRVGSAIFGDRSY